MRRPRGFTLIEVMVVLLIVAIIGGLGWTSLRRVQLRTRLGATSADVIGLLSAARQSALATGRYTVVMVFPDQVNQGNGKGRLVVYEDSGFTFLSTSSTSNLSNFDASLSPTTSSAGLVSGIDLPPGVEFGVGTPAPTFPAPYDTLTPSACSFCGSTAPRRGAVVFDARGRARFFDGAGGSITEQTGTGLFSLTGPELSGQRVFMISPSAGAVRAFGPG